jgi:hypothetical protein
MPRDEAARSSLGFGWRLCSSSGNRSIDADSRNANPLYVDLSSAPPSLDVASNSPAVNGGRTSLTGNRTSICGRTDYAGNPPINGSGQISIGACEQ